MKVVELLGRLLFAFIFLRSGFSHFSSQSIAYANSQGVPAASFLVPASGVLALIGAISIMAGYKARIGAWLIVLFLVPVTFMMHDYWNLTDPMMKQTQMAMFWKNISMLGAALLIAFHGAGPLSVDAKVNGKII